MTNRWYYLGLGFFAGIVFSITLICLMMLIP